MAIVELINGIIVTADLLIEKTKGKVIDRQLILSAKDGQSKWTASEDLAQAASTLHEHNISLHIYSETAFSLLGIVSRPLSDLHPRPRSVRRMAQLEGELHSGSRLSISIQMNPLLQPYKLPTPARSASQVTNAQPLDLVKAYRYGQDGIPLSHLDQQQLALKVTNRIFLLGFTPLNSISVDWWMGPAALLTGQDAHAQCLLRDLSQAMRRMGRAAVCRLARQEGAAPRLIALLDNEEAGLLSVGLPWSEGVRAFAFPSLVQSLTALLPTEAQMEAMRQFVQAANAKGELAPLLNPAYANLLERIALRAHDPDASITPNPPAFVTPCHPTELIAELFPRRPVPRWS